MRKEKVCILTAGVGSRMGSRSESINKALLPIDGKAIITHIIEKFSPDNIFVIALGHLGSQVKSFLQVAHSDLTFEFVNVERYTGLGSGPGHSLACCESNLEEPFFLVSCDTLWSDDNVIAKANENWVGVASVEADISSAYCNLKIRNDVVETIFDKVTVSGEEYKAFSGLCFIKDTSIFFNGLKERSVIDGEMQISNGLKALINSSNISVREINWIDVGTSDKYKNAVSHYENFDFSKQNEALYIHNKKVIKMFVDQNIAADRVKKSALNPKIFPKIEMRINQFYSYDFVDGETLYKYNNQKIFTKLLKWLKKEVWRDVEVDHQDLIKACNNFYKVKTLNRLSLYDKKYPNDKFEKVINGKRVIPLENLLSAIPWEILRQGKPCFIHGDLQFDNILYDEKSDQFKLLDWRQDFSGHIEFGDLYYDLSKLYGGINLNYDYIKENLFSYNENFNEIDFDFAQRNSHSSYTSILHEHIADEKLDLFKVQLLVGIIYLNMSPLHHYPFDKMLYSLGRYTVSNVLGV